LQDFAPHIYRQRLVIEGLADQVITAEDIEKYLSQLSVELDMVELLTPVTHRSDAYGWAGWIHWETSGAHFYAWENPIFFSVDIYTCKSFSAEAAVAFTKSFFGATEIDSREL
jgi:S-adenosylmethionine/arginine decarboxylase-like enzyme